MTGESVGCTEDDFGPDSSHAVCMARIGSSRVSLLSTAHNLGQDG